MTAHDPRVSRRALIGTGGLAALGAALVACAPDTRDAERSPAPEAPTAVPVHGRHQAGIARPTLGQSSILVAVYDLQGSAADAFATLGTTIAALAAGDHAGLGGIAPGDLTVTVGAGPRLVAAVDASLPGAEALPSFPLERLAPSADAGDVLLQVCASDPLVVPLALGALEAAVPGLRRRWHQRGVRGPYERVDERRAAPRNLLGFVDGIAVPATNDEFDAGVWIAEGAAAGGSIAVVRRMEFDVAAFHALPLPEQEAIIGRERASSAPLSGGSIADDVNLQAKEADGRYRIPATSHARRAHPTTVGVPLMLRRSYSMDDPPGLLFVSFQSELRAFTATMERMVESDALIERTTSTAAGAFLILPGFTESAPLGSTIFRS